MFVCMYIRTHYCSGMNHIRKAHSCSYTLLLLLLSSVDFCILLKVCFYLEISVSNQTTTTTRLQEDFTIFFQFFGLQFTVFFFFYRFYYIICYVAAAVLLILIFFGLFFRIICVFFLFKICLEFL